MIRVPSRRKEEPAGKLEKTWLWRDWRTRNGASKSDLGRVERLLGAVMGSQVAGRSWGAGREVFVLRAESGSLTYLSLRCPFASNCHLSDPSSTDMLRLRYSKALSLPCHALRVLPFLSPGEVAKLSPFVPVKLDQSFCTHSCSVPLASPRNCPS